MADTTDPKPAPADPKNPHPLPNVLLLRLQQAATGTGISRKRLGMLAKSEVFTPVKRETRNSPYLLYRDEVLVYVEARHKGEVAAEVAVRQFRIQAKRLKTRAGR